MNSPGWEPAGVTERVRAIDIIRGLALFGVLIINILSDFRVPLLEHVRRPFAGLQGAGRAVELLAACLLEFKSFTIFSLLFGVGIAIQTNRAMNRNVATRTFLLKRLTFLLVLGATHLFLVWNGDILTLYAICGLFLLVLNGLPWRILFVVGAALIVLPEFLSFNLNFPSGQAAVAAIALTREVYGHEGYLAIVKFRWHETWSLIVPLLMMVFLRTAGLMCWGAAAWRGGILQAPERHRGKLAMALGLGALVGGAITGNQVWATSGHAPWPVLQNMHVDASILLAMAYVSGLLLWLKPRRASLLPGLAAMGQMALTNYLLQSIVLGWVFYGYGFGLFGRLGSAAAAGIGVALYVVQVRLSRLWLGHFRFGPVEWLWRTVSYGRLQPLRVLPPHVAVPMTGAVEI